MNSNEQPTIEVEEEDLNDVLMSSSEINKTYNNIVNNFTNLRETRNNEVTDEEEEQILHELKVIYNLRAIVNECENLLKKTNQLKSKTIETSFISIAQSQLIESIQLYQKSEQKLNESIQSIDESSSILFLNNLPSKQINKI